MSSVLSGFRGRSDLPIPNGAVVVSFLDGDDNSLPVPFTFNNGILDMDFSSGFSSNKSIETDNAYLRYSINALHLVTGIGPNLIAWMENAGGADAGSVRMYDNAIVIRANAIQPFTNVDSEEPNVENVTGTSSTPYNFTNSAGSVANNNYYSTYLFKKALVLQYTVEGTTQYRFFNSHVGEMNE
jgi:hypothetical protein